MFIPVSIRDCRTAIAAAIAATQALIDKDRATIAQRSYDQLYAGAVHNGLKPTQGNIEQMKEMSERDVAHMMEGHPGVLVVERLNILVEMLDYYPKNSGDQAVIGTEDFLLIKKHLTKPE